MSKQTALIVSKIAGRVELTSDWPIPQPEPGEVQIRLTTAALNPHDQRARDNGLFIKETLPAVLANDIVGVVTLLGPGVTKYKVGDEIVAQSYLSGSRQKGLQQYATVTVDFSSKVPHGFKDHDLVTVPTNALAAVISLFDVSGLAIPAPWNIEAQTFDYARSKLLIIGGGTNCGKFGVQLASLAGIGEIIVVGGDEVRLKEWGATHVIDRHRSDDEILRAIHNIAGDELIYAFDTINLPNAQHLAINALSSRRKGRLARLRFSTGTIDTTKILEDKAAGYELCDVLGISHLKPQTAKPFWERLEGYFESKRLEALDHQVFQGLDAERVNEVLDRYRDGKRVIQTQFRIST
jgi:NADPH2:quinone reductase